MYTAASFAAGFVFGLGLLVAGMQLPLAASDAYVRAFGEMFGALAEKNRAALSSFQHDWDLLIRLSAAN